MITRIMASIILILALSPPFNEAYSQDSGIKTKSDKNELAKDVTITPEQVTGRDLLNSPQNGDWLLYHGDYGANRFSPLDQINLSNVSKLVPKWTGPIGKRNFNLRSSPIVYKGIMYVTASDEVHALDAATGAWLWVWRARNENSSNINRGVAIFGDRLFFSTGDCYLVALDRISGNTIWSKQFADPANGYFSTMAPLVVGERIIMGISNQNAGLPGFVVAFSGSIGMELWRFWSAPLNMRGAPTWMTGSYDPVLDIVYWAVGSLKIGSSKPSGSTNVYDNSMVALNPESGKVIWSTKLGANMPLDWWDANEPLVLADLRIGNIVKKAVLQAHRNGVFFLVDRISGEIILSKPFIKKINWSKKDACPSMWGATNWMSPSFSPATKLFYVMVHEGCLYGPNQFHIKAIHPASGGIVWDYLTRGSNLAAPGILSTAGGIVFSGEGSGHVVILDAKNGEKVWDFNTGKPIFASPVTYLSRGKQLISVATGSHVVTFGLH